MFQVILIQQHVEHVRQVLTVSISLQMSAGVVQVFVTRFVVQARVALRLPWWSLASGFAATRDLAGLQGSAIQVHKALTEQTMAANGALPPGALPAKDKRQVAIFDPKCSYNLCVPVGGAGPPRGGGGGGGGGGSALTCSCER